MASTSTKSEEIDLDTAITLLKELREKRGNVKNFAKVERLATDKGELLVKDDYTKGGFVVSLQAAEPVSLA